MYVRVVSAIQRFEVQGPMMGYLGDLQRSANILDIVTGGGNRVAVRMDGPMKGWVGGRVVGRIANVDGWTSG